MDEAEWLTGTDPTPMLKVLHGRVSDRKLRLFACACCRAVWDDTWPHRSRGVIEVAERFADGRATDAELTHARALASQSAQNAVRHVGRRRHGYAGRTLKSRLLHAADAAQPCGALYFARDETLRDDKQMRRVGPPLLRCIFGSPFRSATVDPGWLTPTVTGLASAIYTENACDRMPVLADALEEAGCDHADILCHCRSGGPHVRGGWVVDLLLGME